jgi:hypothetical protein
VLDDFLASLFGDYALDSLRGRWVARIVVGLAVLAVVAAVVFVAFYA